MINADAVLLFTMVAHGLHMLQGAMPSLAHIVITPLKWFILLPVSFCITRNIFVVHNLLIWFQQDRRCNCLGTYLEYTVKLSTVHVLRRFKSLCGIFVTWQFSKMLVCFNINDFFLIFGTIFNCFRCHWCFLNYENGAEHPSVLVVY